MEINKLLNENNKLTTEQAIKEIENNHDLVFLGDSDTIIYWVGEDDYWKLSNKDKWVQLYKTGINSAIEAYYHYDREIFCLKRDNNGTVTSGDHYYIPDRTMMNVDAIKMTCINILYGEWYIGRIESDRKKKQDEFLKRCRY